jgi:hypothetical protein
MNNTCFKLNPLQRDGTNQNQRLVKALHPSYVSMDERDIDDLLLYARRLAQTIRHYNDANQRNGDWLAFIENDISTLVSIILNKDLEALKAAFDEAHSLTTQPAVNQKSIGIGNQFSILFRIFAEVDSWYKRSVEGLALKHALEVKIRSSFNETLRNVISLCRIFKEGTGIDNCILDISSLDEIWNTENIEDTSLVDDPADLATSTEALDHLAGELKLAFEKAFGELEELQNDAPEYLTETLESYPEHQPYMALFLTFLSLFMHARDHLNTITRRHLNFYYRDVLRIESAPEIPDRVHMIFELAKAFQTHLVEKGTVLKDRKDNNGAEIFFATDDELVVNKAKIDPETAFKSVFIHKEYDETNPDRDTAYEIKNIYAAPIANSADGLGTDLEDEDGKWQTFGNEKMPYATIGFAISSPILSLNEGNRTITFSFDFEDPDQEIFGKGEFNNQLVACELKNNISIDFSGEKGWIPGKIVETVAEKLTGTKGRYIFKIELPPEAPAVLDYDDEILQAGFTARFPVARFILNNDGLDVRFLPGSFKPLEDFNEISAVSPWLANRVVNLLNSMSSAEELAGDEPQLGPVVDNPFTGYGDQVDDYDIGITVAKRIIDKRNGYSAKKFSSLRQLTGIRGFGIDKLNDLLYTVDCPDVNKIKDESPEYDPKTSFSQHDTVFYQGKLYKSLINSNKGFRPDVNPDQWLLIKKSYPYKYFRPLTLDKLKISVAVTGVKNIVVENDTGRLDSAKPFMPFGPVPRVGSSFYLGSREIFKKVLSGPEPSEVDINVTWTNLPDDGFNDHYANYKYKSGNNFFNYFNGNNDDFTASIEVLHKSQWQNFASNQKLFNSSGSDVLPDKTFSLNDLISDRNPNLKDFEAYGHGFERGFIRFKLNHGFLHKYYAECMTTSALNPDNVGTPREPHTPVISEISLDYTSSREIDFTKLDKHDFEGRIEKMFHIRPFGINEFFAIDDESDAGVFVSQMLVPGFLLTEINEETGEVITDLNGEPRQTDTEGTLYIGIDDLHPEQNLSILFQVAEGSENPEKEKQEVRWHFLAANNWHEFGLTQIISDDTNGLLRSGIIKFSMPKTITTTNTVLPAGKHWIRATIARSSDAVCKTIAIMPQAVSATFAKSEENDLNRLSEPLTAESVSKLKQGHAAIKKVLQPFASFDGQLAEIASDFDATGQEENNAYYIRVSERLRHKQRGITIFDYERLVLQQFPEVYKVKCINHTSEDCEHSPGNVTVVAIPDLRNKNAVDPLEPRLSLNKLEEIKTFLLPHISDFVTLDVKNPDYEKVQVSFNVQFMPGKDKGFYTTKLQEDIRRFLTPWLFDEGKDLILGGSVHRSAVLNFIEETDYVDFLTDFKMFHTNRMGIKKEVEEARASTSSSTLVSSSEHIINFDIEVACLK